MPNEKPIATLSIKEIIEKCDTGGYGLPLFQRDFVWSGKKVKEFLKSIYHGDPAGMVVIWKTDCDGRKLGPVTEEGSLFQNFKDGLIIDGQQRITALYFLYLRGKIPSAKSNNFEDIEVVFDAANEEFLERKESDDESKGLRLDDIWKRNRGESQDCVKKVNEMLNYHFPVWSLRLNGNENEVGHAIDLFDRINSSGQRIEPSDIALGWLKEKDKKLGRDMAFTQKNWEIEKNYEVTEGVILNTLLSLSGKSISKPVTQIKTLLEEIKTEDKINERWELAKLNLDRAIDFISKYCGFDTDEFLFTHNVLITLALYFSKKHKNPNYLSEPERKKLRAWLYWTIIEERYGQTSKFRSDLKTLNNEDNLNPELVKPPSYRLRKKDVRSKKFYDGMASAMWGAAFWNGLEGSWGQKMDSRRGKKSILDKIERDHIFSRRWSRDRVRRYAWDIDCVANLAFLEKAANAHYRDSPPREKLENQPREILRKQWIPESTELLEAENFQNFLERRSGMIARYFNREILGE